MVKINWSPNSKELRQFGISLLVGFGIIGGIFFWRDYYRPALFIWAIAGAVGLLAIAIPILSKPFYWVWMSIALILGTVISSLILAIIYFLIITPIGWVMRIGGRDALRLKKPVNTESYWLDHPKLDDKNYDERIF